MPIFTYKCPTCSMEKKTIRDFEKREDPVPCRCGQSMQPQLPKMQAPTVNVTVDKYRNVSNKDGLTEQLRERAKEHFIRRGEMTEAIEKHGIETAKRMGWIKPDGKKISVIDTK